MIQERSGKSLLHELEAVGIYVFHGSPVANIKELKVTQPFYSEVGKEKKKHGQPAVVATPYADIAIFRALVYLDTTGFGVDGDRLSFEATTKALEFAKDQKGCVYVLAKENFLPMEGDVREMDWRSSSPQHPIRVVEVTLQDLPKNIRIIENRRE